MEKSSSHSINIRTSHKDGSYYLTSPPSLSPSVSSIMSVPDHKPPDDDSETSDVWVPTTNEVIKTFASYTEIQKGLKISIKKIKELVENNETYQGKYKFMPAKI